MASLMILRLIVTVKYFGVHEWGKVADTLTLLSLSEISPHLVRFKDNMV